VNSGAYHSEENRVLVITYYFPPSGGAGVQRWLKFCKYMPEEGVHPIVLTVDERYASYPQTDYSLSEEVSPDLQVVKTRTREPLRFYRYLSPTGELPHTGLGNEQQPTFLQKLSRFVRGNLFLPDPRRGWNRYAYQAACRLIEQYNISTIVTTSPPHSTQLVGWRLKRRYPHIHWVADLRDPWTDIFYGKNLYPTSLARCYNAGWERRVLEQADEVVTVSEGCRLSLAGKTRQPISIHVIPNGYDETDFVPNYAQRPHAQFILAYVGSLNPLYEIRTLVSALQLLPPAIKDTILLRFVGGAYADLVTRFEQAGIQTERLGYLFHKKAVSHMQAADMLLLLLPDQPESKAILTGKLFEYMATGHPVLMIGCKDGDAAKLLHLYQDEGVFAAGEAEQIAQFITRAVTSAPIVHPEAAAPYNRRNLTRQLVQLLR